MAKFVFELMKDHAETSLFLPISGDLVFLFSPSLEGYVTVGERAYEVTDGRVAIPYSELPKGEFTPELITKERKWRLPKLMHTGDTVIPKPYDDECIDALIRELKEIKSELVRLATEATKLKEKVYGTLFF